MLEHQVDGKLRLRNVQTLEDVRVVQAPPEVSLPVHVRLVSVRHDGPLLQGLDGNTNVRVLRLDKRHRAVRPLAQAANVQVVLVNARGADDAKGQGPLQPRHAWTAVHQVRHVGRGQAVSSCQVPLRPQGRPLPRRSTARGCSYRSPARHAPRAGGYAHSDGQRSFCYAAVRVDTAVVRCAHVTLCPFVRPRSLCEGCALASLERPGCPTVAHVDLLLIVPIFVGGASLVLVQPYISTPTRLSDNRALLPHDGTEAQPGLRIVKNDRLTTPTLLHLFDPLNLWQIRSSAEQPRQHSSLLQARSN
mmetsp:Transcript_3021/g.9893  ORF Transcript_3021/g.9893 Transcript_3021/m.9893 type:complete len:304 (-) Transcript_3021:30-941(-)